MTSRKLIYFTALIIFSLSGHCSGDEITLELPPESLEKWYKPTSKRQVWLHTMFKLRREMLAIHEYSKAGDFSSMEKWLSRLDTHYNKLGVMVPEWKHRLKPELIINLKMFIQQKEVNHINKTMNAIRRNCKDCHNDFQSVVTMLYRTPDYDDITIINDKGDKQTLHDNMNELSNTVNRLLIALDDNRKPVALQARDHLSTQLQSLATSCNDCHRDDPYPGERILGQATQQQLLTLQSYIQQDRTKDSQKLMGQIAVNVCSRCHNIHRTVYEIRKALSTVH